MYSDAIDNASRFGDIPFVEFTKELVTGVFDSLVDAHILQMEEYANFVNSLTQDLSTYINNTKDNVSFEQVADFVTSYELPEVDQTAVTAALAHLQSPDTTIPELAEPGTGAPATASTWWGGLINGLAPAVTSLVDKLGSPADAAKYKALTDYNDAVLAGTAIAERKAPNYNEIYDAVASLIASSKYGLLQTMAKQGVMRLVVTEGEIETKITFSTWNNSSRGKETKEKVRNKNLNKKKSHAGINVLGLFSARKKDKNVNRTVTVNTAKSYQRDSSGTRVDIFGRVLIRFKTDYAPLNG